MRKRAGFRAEVYMMGGAVHRAGRRGVVVKDLVSGLLVVGFAILMISSVATPASAVIGKDDGDGHPYVGLMAYQPVEDGPWYIAPGGSATLVSADVAVTAGHVIASPPFFGFYPHAMGVVFHPTPVDISIVPDPADVAGYPRGRVLREVLEEYVHRASPFVHPDFGTHAGGSGRILSDIGVLVFDDPVSGPTATISPEQPPGEVLRLVRASDGKITMVGYGAGEFRPPSFPGDGRRRVADLTVTDITNAELWAWRRAETDGGGAPGDSGGPAFLKGTSVVVGVMSTITFESQVVTGFSRTGSTSACQFLADFLDDLSCSK